MSHGTRGVERHVGAPVAPVPLEAALVLDRDDPVAQPDLRDRPVERGAVEVVEAGGAADQELVRARPEQETGAVQAADRGGVFGLRAGLAGRACRAGRSPRRA